MDEDSLNQQLPDASLQNTDLHEVRDQTPIEELQQHQEAEQHQQDDNNDQAIGHNANNRQIVIEGEIDHNDSDGDQEQINNNLDDSQEYGDEMHDEDGMPIQDSAADLN